MSSTTALPGSQELAVHREQVTVVQKQAMAYDVSADSLEAGERFLRDIKRVEESVEDRKKEITRPLMQALASARDLFKPFELTLADSKKIVKAKILAYEAEQNEKARIEEERIAKRAEKGTLKPETAAAKLGEIAEKKVKTNSRTLVKVRVVDESLVPREYCSPDLSKITEAVLYQGAEIAGVERYEEKILVTK